jgi:hypothetical protein
MLIIRQEYQRHGTRQYPMRLPADNVTKVEEDNGIVILCMTDKVKLIPPTICLSTNGSRRRSGLIAIH